MRVDVVGRGVTIPDGVRAHAEERAGKLPKYFDGTRHVTYTVTRADSHVGYHAEIVIDVEKSHSFVASGEGEDLTTLIDEVTQKGVRQLTDFKERLKGGKRG